MRYIKVIWMHEFDDEPNVIYSEINGESIEVRKIEVYKDESFGLASETIEFGGTALAEAPIPTLEEIRENPEFLPKEISKDEFESIWSEYINYLNE